MVTYSSINFDFILLDLISFCFVGFVSFRFGLTSLRFRFNLISFRFILILWVSFRFGMLSFVSVYFVSSLRFVSFALRLHFTDTPDLWYYSPRHIKINKRFCNLNPYYLKILSENLTR